MEFLLTAMRLLKLILMIAAAITIAVAFFKARKASQLVVSSSGFVFTKGRLWALTNNNQTLALIDSGTAMSVFPNNWPSLAEVEGRENVLTTFGQRQLDVRKLKMTRIGNEYFEGKVLAGEVSYPIIGNDFIFRANNVLFTRDGLEFDVDYRQGDAIACVGAIVGYQGNTISTPVGSIRLVLNINNTEQIVYFDTGRASTLEASALAPRPIKNLFPRVDIRFNSLGEWSLVPYFSRKALISIGGQKEIIPYRHYYIDRTEDTPFVMGAGILRNFSILIEPRKGRACFFQ